MTMKEAVERADEAAALTAAACLFHGFSDPSRLAILQPPGARASTGSST